VLSVSEDSAPTEWGFSRYEDSSPNASVPLLCICAISPTRLSLSMVVSLQKPASVSPGEVIVVVFEKCASSYVD
jgi:hypothetical protein